MSIESEKIYVEKRGINYYPGSQQGEQQDIRPTETHGVLPAAWLRSLGSIRCSHVCLAKSFLKKGSLSPHVSALTLNSRVLHIHSRTQVLCTRRRVCGAMSHIRAYTKYW